MVVLVSCKLPTGGQYALGYLKFCLLQVYRCFPHIGLPFLALPLTLIVYSICFRAHNTLRVPVHIHIRYLHHYMSLTHRVREAAPQVIEVSSIFLFTSTLS